MTCKTTIYPWNKVVAVYFLNRFCENSKRFYLLCYWPHWAITAVSKNSHCVKAGNVKLRSQSTANINQNHQTGLPWLQRDLHAGGLTFQVQATPPDDLWTWRQTQNSRLPARGTEMLRSLIMWVQTRTASYLIDAIRKSQFERMEVSRLNGSAIRRITDALVNSAEQLMTAAQWPRGQLPSNRLHQQPLLPSRQPGEHTDTDTPGEVTMVTTHLDQWVCVWCRHKAHMDTSRPQ